MEGAVAKGTNLEQHDAEYQRDNDEQPLGREVRPRMETAEVGSPRSEDVSSSRHAVSYTRIAPLNPR